MRVVYYVAASEDGFIAPPDGSVEWLQPYEQSGEDFGYHDFYSGVDALIMGRRTFDQVLTFGDWPYPGKPCWVWTRRPCEQRPREVDPCCLTPCELVSLLRAAGHRKVWMVGGGETAGAFWELLDEVILSVLPVHLGDGIPVLAGIASLDGFPVVEREEMAMDVVQERRVRRP